MIYWLLFFHMTKFWLSGYWWRRGIQVCWQVGLVVFLEVFTFTAPRTRERGYLFRITRKIFHFETCHFKIIAKAIFRKNFSSRRFDSGKILRAPVCKNQTNSKFRGKGAKFDFFHILMLDRLGYTRLKSLDTFFGKISFYFKEKCK